MATVTLGSANRIRVPDRAGELVINRFDWPVTVQANGDKVIVGYLPANCRIKADESQTIADGATGAMTFDVCVDIDGQVIDSADAITAATFKRTGHTAYQTVETIGKTDANRAVYLKLTTAPTVAGGHIYVDLAVYDPAA